MGQRPVYPPGTSPFGADPYSSFFDVNALPPETAAAYRQHRFYATFSVVLLILVHILTFGFASPFLVARKYAFLPAVRPDDFSTGKAVGFLFIPLFGLYWVFVVCRRIVDRLTLQARLWDLPGAPSRGLARAVAIGWVISAIPYLGLLFVIVMYVALWPIYLAQIQAVCNRLAMEAAPAEARADMLRLERAMRLRWLGWIILAPCLVSVATGLIATVIVPARPIAETIVGTMILTLIGSIGGVLLYFGERDMHELHYDLESVAPWILAGYLRIDKNAAWTVAWVTIPLGLLFVLGGVVALAEPNPTVPQSEAWPSIVLGVVLGVVAAYALVRALQLKRQIAWLAEAPPAPDERGPLTW